MSTAQGTRTTDRGDSAPATDEGAPRWSDAARWALLVVLLLCAVADLVLAPGHSSEAGAGLGAYAGVAAAAYAVPGTVLLLRRRWHPLGWLLVVVSVLMSLSFAGDWNQTTASPWLRLMVDETQGSLFWLPFVVLLVWFPEGVDDRTPRRRALGRLLIGATAAACVVELLSRTVTLDSGATEPSPLQPLAVIPDHIADSVLLVTLASLAVAGIDLVRRYRASQSTRRLQYRWVVAALVLLLASLVIGLVAPGITGWDVWWYPILVAYVALPVSIAIAITRFRLYEIDRIISRTVGHTVVVVLLAVLGIGGVSVVTSLLPTQDRLAVALTTVAVVALFDPLRRRVVDAVDRRFDRTRYVARQVVEGFGRDVQDITDLDEIGSRVHAVVARTVAPSTIAVWQPPEGGR